MAMLGTDERGRYTIDRRSEMSFAGRRRGIVVAAPARETCKQRFTAITVETRPAQLAAGVPLPSARPACDASMLGRGHHIPPECTEPPQCLPLNEVAT